MLVILIVTFPILIVLTNARLIILNNHYYAKKFTEYNIYTKISDADDILTNITAYFKNKEKNLQVDVFTENEISHMKDVKVLIHKFLVIYYILVLLNILLFYGVLRKNHNILGTMIAIFVFTSLIIILGSAILYLFRNSFSIIFIRFHETFFPQGNWMFPFSTTLIRMFPNEFFYSTFYSIIFRSFIVALFFMGFGILFFVINKVRNHR